MERKTTEGADVSEPEWLNGIEGGLLIVRSAEGLFLGWVDQKGYDVMVALQDTRSRMSHNRRLSFGIEKGR